MDGPRGRNCNITNPAASAPLRLVALAAAAVVSCTSCSRPEPRETPRETLARLLAARERGDYQEIRPLIVPEHAEQVLSTLMAVDDFLVANRELCGYVRDEVGLGLAQSIDQSHIGANLEIFSPYVELLDEIVAAETATVTFLVDGKLPVKQAELRRIGGAWRYDPGPGYAPEIPRAFLRMARGLRQTLQEIKSGRLPAEALRDDPELLAREVRVRLLPGVNMLPQPDHADGHDE